MSVLSLVVKVVGSAVFAVLVAPSGKAVWASPAHDLKNLKAALAAADLAAAVNGWSVNGAPVVSGVSGLYAEAA